MTGSVELRTLTQDDWERALEVYRQCEDFLALGPQPRASREMVLADVAASQREGGVFQGIYAAGARLIGIVDYVPLGFDGDPRVAFLALLMIAAPFRGQGTGTEVVGIVEREIMKDSRITTILSAVQENSHQALRFWRKMGYRVVSHAEPQPDGTTTFRLQKDLQR